MDSNFTAQAEAVSQQVLTLYSRAGRDNSTEHEQVVLAFVRLLHWHSQKGPIPPGKMRRALEHALSLYPSNQLFLSLYIRGEARSQLENRLRRYFDEKCTLYVISRHCVCLQLTFFSVCQRQQCHCVALCDPYGDLAPWLWTPHPYFV